MKYGDKVTLPPALKPAPDSTLPAVTVKLSEVLVITSKVFCVKSALTKPVPEPGKVTLANKNKSPTSKPCEALFTVTVAELFVVVNVHDVMLVSKGDIS